MPHRPGRFVVVDLETTGLSPRRGDRVIEIGAVALENGTIAGEFHTLIDPGRPVHPRAQQVHGITDGMLLGMPKPDAVFPQFHRFLGGSPLVAHNAPFDMTFLRHEFGRFGLGLSIPFHCTLRLCRQRFPKLPDHRLETVARHLLGPLPAETRLHRALTDARLTARVWVAMNQGDHKDRPYGER